MLVLCKVSSRFDHAFFLCRCDRFGAPIDPGPAPAQRLQGFGHAVYCARHALGVSGHCGTEGSSRACNGNGNGARVPSAGEGVSGESGRSHAHKRGENGRGEGGGVGSEGDCGVLSATGTGVGSDEEESFLLVLGDHLYRRGSGTTRACASQLIHAFLKHGEIGKPAIGLKVRLWLRPRQFEWGQHRGRAVFFFCGAVWSSGT